MESYSFSGIKDMDLVHTFECGQCFRWEKQDDGSYIGIANGRRVRVELALDTDAEPQTPDVSSASKKLTITPCTESEQRASDLRSGAKTLTITPCTDEEFETIWRKYFDLDRDYSAIKKVLIDSDDTRDHVMKSATEYGYGIRILGQDFWETIVSFIISQNNNIPRIKGCIKRLSDNFGAEIPPERDVLSAEPVKASSPVRSIDSGGAKGLADTGCGSAHEIPSPEVLAALSIEDLAPVRLGYRAKYLIETAKAVIENGLPETEEELSALCGVGPKVANCISLFGMRAYDSFPIDVWVMKVMHELYGLDEGDKKAMAAFAKDKFGELGGFAQQYLFYYMRDRS